MKQKHFSQFSTFTVTHLSKNSTSITNKRSVSHIIKFFDPPSALEAFFSPRRNRLERRVPAVEALMTRGDSPRSIYRRRWWRADAESTIYYGDSSGCDFSRGILAGPRSLIDRAFYPADLEPSTGVGAGHSNRFSFFPPAKLLDYPRGSLTNGPPLKSLALEGFSQAFDQFPAADVYTSIPRFRDLS